MNFLVPEAVRLTILEHIGLHQVREKAKRISGMCEYLHLLETFVRRATNRWTVLYRPGLALRVSKPRKNTFFRSRFFLSMTSYSAKNRPESMLHRVPGLYEIESDEPNDIVFNPMWRQGCPSELALSVGVGSARFMSPGKGDDPPIPCFRLTNILFQAREWR